jgi:hypothetical protein
MELPTFEEMLRNAFAMLGDVEDELHSDWRDGTEPTATRGAAARRAKGLIAQTSSAQMQSAQTSVCRSLLPMGSTCRGPIGLLRLVLRGGERSRRMSMIASLNS